MTQLPAFHTLALFNKSVGVWIPVGCVLRSAYNYVRLLFKYLELLVFVVDCHVVSQCYELGMPFSRFKFKELKYWILTAIANIFYSQLQNN
jgi:hypothetical protein